MDESNRADAVGQLLDKQAIHEVLMRYCRGVDRIDGALISSSFHPDARCEFGKRILEGEGIGNTIAETAAAFDLTHHMVGNELIELQGDSAVGESYYLSSTVISGEHVKQVRVRAGRYVDRLERRDGEWRLAHRLVVEDWCRVDSLPELAPDTAFCPGVQGLSDPLYSMIAPPSQHS